MNRPLSLPCIVFLCLFLGACAAPGPAFLADGGPWVSVSGRDHPLAGKIWSHASGKYVNSDRLLDEVAKSDFILLGETHDNEDHHRIQAWIVARLFARGRRPAVAFEMFTVDQSGTLRNAIARHPRDAAGLGPALGWAQRGWPDWRQYQPIAQAALDAGAPILAADLPRPTINAIGKEGTRALGERLEQLLALDVPMPKDLTRSLRREIVEAHCDLLPASMVDPMTKIMQARDAHMANALIAGSALAGRDSAVLITGKGHARLDIAVPFHLRRLAPGRSTSTIAMVEVTPGETDPTAYAARFNTKTLPYDYVWFTPRPDRDAACERFADQLRRAKDRHENRGKSK